MVDNGCVFCLNDVMYGVYCIVEVFCVIFLVIIIKNGNKFSWKINGF